jgi:hypothetical protein
VDIAALVPVLTTIFAIATVGVAALIVGRSRALREVDTRSDDAAQRLIRDLESRVALLERERIEAAAQIVALEGKVRALEADLTLERAITRRFRLTGEDDGHG